MTDTTDDDHEARFLAALQIERERWRTLLDLLADE